MKTDLSLLCVDDDPDILDLLSSFFADSVQSVDTAVNGRDALNKLSQNLADVVVTDVRMPVMDGYQLLKEIRERDGLAPCVLITSGYTDHSVEALYDLGANGFFPKPFSATAVLKAMKHAVTPPESRWSAAPAFEPTLRLHEEITKSWEDQTEIRFGNGGFSLASEALAQARIGDILGFSIEFADLQFSGTGIIRWMTPLNKPDKNTRLGIEIQSLEEPARATLSAWIKCQKQASFIPKS